MNSDEIDCSSQHPPVHRFVPDGDKFDRQAILRQLFQHEAHSTQSHLINNRWENTYLETHFTPAVTSLLSYAASRAGKICDKKLLVPHQLLGFAANEYWFNMAHPGESTGMHNHRDGSLVSGVYYLDVPQDGGNLFFRREDGSDIETYSKTGEMVLFPSHLDHYVAVNNSSSVRVSLAFNCFEPPVRNRIGVAGYSKNRYFSS